MNEMNIEFTANNNEYESSSLNEQASAVTDEIQDMNPILRDCGIVLHNVGSNSIVLIKKSQNHQMMRIKSSADDFILFFIENVIRYKKTDTRQAYSVVRLAQLLGISEPVMSRIFSMYNWGGIEKGRKYLTGIDILRQPLKQLLFDGKVSIQAAVMFGQFFAEDNYDDMLGMMRTLTFSEMNQNLQYIIEIAKQNGDNRKALSQICEIITDKNAKEISEQIYKMRYPKRSALESIYNEFLNSVKLNNKVNAPFLLEKQQFTLNVGFKDCEDLCRQLDNIRQRLSNVNSAEDMFILDNIFKKYEEQEK